MIVSSIMVTYKMCKKRTKFYPKNTEFERERQLFISLISYDIFFIIFRDPVTFFTSFAYCICLAIGLLSNVLTFVVLILFNKVYKKIYIQIMKCNKNKPKQNELRNIENMTETELIKICLENNHDSTMIRLVSQSNL
jgi:membrane protein insertase Oxa1/YidC/SpoIIIJ